MRALRGALDAAGRVPDDEVRAVPGRGRSGARRRLSRDPDRRARGSRTSIAAIRRCGPARPSSASCRWSRGRLRRSTSGCDRRRRGCARSPRSSTMRGGRSTSTSGRAGGRGRCASARPRRSCSAAACRRGPSASGAAGATIRAFAEAARGRARRVPMRSRRGSQQDLTVDDDPVAAGATICCRCCSDAGIGARRRSTSVWPTRRRAALDEAHARSRRTRAQRWERRVGGRRSADRGRAPVARRLPAAFRANLAALPRDRRRARPGDLARCADSLRADSGRTRARRRRCSTTSSTAHRRRSILPPSTTTSSRRSTDCRTRSVERRLAAANDCAIALNHVVHHGGLGHHVQNWFAYRSRVAHRAGRGGRRRQPHRDVLRRIAGRGLGLLRLRPDGGDRRAHAARTRVACSTRACGSRPARSSTSRCTAAR